MGKLALSRYLIMQIILDYPGILESDLLDHCVNLDQKNAVFVGLKQYPNFLYNIIYELKKINYVSMNKSGRLYPTDEGIAFGKAVGAFLHTDFNVEKGSQTPRLDRLTQKSTTASKKTTTKIERVGEILLQEFFENSEFLTDEQIQHILNVAALVVESLK